MEGLSAEGEGVDYAAVFVVDVGCLVAGWVGVEEGAGVVAGVRGVDCCEGIGFLDVHFFATGAGGVEVGLVNYPPWS